MGGTVHCETFLPSMRDLTEDSNSCSLSVYCGDKNLTYGQFQNGFLVRAAADSYSGYERDFLKQTMLEHETVFKNQVYELHRLYRTQKNLMDEVRGKKFSDRMNHSEHTPESAIKQKLPGYLLGNSICGEGNSSQACNVPLQNIISSKDEVLEVRPMKLRRKMIDLQLPADECLDTDGENSSCPPCDQSKAGKEVGEKLFFERGSASQQNYSSRSSLFMKNPNGLADLNEPVQCQESEQVPSSRDSYAPYGRNIAHLQGQWLEKNTSQNGWVVLEAGNGKISPKDTLCMPSNSVQVLSNNAFQPLGYPSTDHRKLLGQRASFECETRQRNPEVSYGTFVESSEASNAPSLNHGYRPESARPWSHWISSGENRSSISVQKSLPRQTNPFLNFNTKARADPSSAMRSLDFGRLYQGFSSGSKETAFNFPSGNFNHLNNSGKGTFANGSLSEALKHQSIETRQRPKMQECSAGLPWIKPKPPNKNEITNGGLDLNGSANQFMDESDVGDCSNNVSPHNGLRSVSCSTDADLGQIVMADTQSSRKILGFPISQEHSICEEVNTLVKRNLDINLPCEASVSEAVVVEKEEGKKAATCRHYIDLNLCASEDEGSGLCSNPRMETKATTMIDLEAPPTLESEDDGEKLPEKRDEETWRSEKGEAGDSVDELIKAAAEAIVTISLSHNCRDTDEAASSSTNAVAKDPLSWFVNTIASYGTDLETKIDACLENRDFESCREECSSEEFDYFEAMTLNLPQTKEEDYMPKPLVPEYLKFEMGSLGITSNRPRRGQARRGRPRRNFQKDTLPGLASLSRLEVTKDLQMFGGLMKATSYSWNSGVARRSSNRGGSNRKRLVSNIDRAPVCSSLVQPINNNSVQMVGLEDRSFTGWGNTTRRPRRQRCPAGTHSTVILT